MPFSEGMPSDHGNNEIKETLRVLFRPLNEDYEYTLPANLPSRRELDKLKPRPEWAKESLERGLNRAFWSGHGDGHMARIAIYAPLAMELMAQNGKIMLAKEQKAAIRFSGVTHDLRYGSDRLESVMSAITKKPGHQERAADKEWLRNIFADLEKEKISLFSEVSLEDVIQLTSQINRVHDYTSNSRVLAILGKEFPDVNIKEIPLELEIFRDIDAGLERLRTEEAYKRILNRALLTRPFRKMILRQNWVEFSLRRLHFPHFEETRQLLPFAMKLYHQSIKKPEYKTDQWKATMDTALELGAIKE